MPIDDMFDAIPEHYTVQHIMDNFNFYVVEHYMRTNNWTWISAKGASTPTVTELKSVAERILKTCRASRLEHMSLGTGGFTAIKQYNELALHFSIAESSDDYDEHKYLD